ncbi:MAG: lipopolysaccharide heptosyltransferase I [Burkholderiales bacterium]|nr:lipopolysaccharide heptosyltransferase I [Burkholderiales bacterium]
MSAILLIKTSSLGDVVHNLPVVNDIRAGLGEDTIIDWVVEQAFAAIPKLHPGVRRVIPCELRRWRGSWWRGATRWQWRAFVGQLRAERYDAIIDTQGLFKSALVARAADGRRFGLDWRSSREPLRLFYHRTFRVPWCEHAIERNRRLCALALGYTLRGAPDYGLRSPLSRPSWLPHGFYAVLLHATSHPRKLWPEERWSQLGAELQQSGLALVLPWGSLAEHARAKRLAQCLPGALVPDKLDLEALAAVIAASAATIGVDTGLTHLAAALGVPVVGIYGATDPAATGVLSAGLALNLGTPGRFPSVADVVAALGRLGAPKGPYPARQDA